MKKHPPSKHPKNLKRKFQAQGQRLENDNQTELQMKFKRSLGPPRSDKCLLYSTDWEKSALLSNFRKRGWLQVPSFDGQWNFYWACTQNCRYIFGVDHPYRMRSDQIINHFPNSVELSRKDLLIKNIKRYRKDLERKGDPLATTYGPSMKLGIGGTRYIHLDIIPMTFVLPTDYNLLVEEFHKNPASTWIVKPCSKSQGVGIFLVNKLSKLKKYAYDARTFYPHFNRDTCVISKYIDNPLLIGGKKFDLRLYVLVTTFNPLKAYLYNEGFCRFCTEKYDQTEIDNVFMHLTNVSIQKTNEEYNTIHGGKWPMQNLWLYLDSMRGEGVSDVLWNRISDTIRHSLNAVAPVMANDRHCFEVYGYDIIIDNNLKPWLVEINTSPSMHSTTTNDRMLKARLIDNVLPVVLPPTGIPDDHWDKTPHPDLLKNFTLLLPMDKEKPHSTKRPPQRNVGKKRPVVKLKINKEDVNATSNSDLPSTSQKSPTTIDQMKCLPKWVRYNSPLTMLPPILNFQRQVAGSSTPTPPTPPPPSAAYSLASSKSPRKINKVEPPTLLYLEQSFDYYKKCRQKEQYRKKDS